MRRGIAEVSVLMPLNELVVVAQRTVVRRSRALQRQDGVHEVLAFRGRQGGYALADTGVVGGRRVRWTLRRRHLGEGGGKGYGGNQERKQWNARRVLTCRQLVLTCGSPLKCP